MQGYLQIKNINNKRIKMIFGIQQLIIKAKAL